MTAAAGAALNYRVCPFIFVCDVSRSMSGTHIKALNTAVRALMSKFSDMNGSNPHIKIKVAIMAFSVSADWITGDELQDPEEYEAEFQDLNTDSFTLMGRMFAKLNASLNSENGLFRGGFRSTKPIIMLFSDGRSTEDFQSSLEELKKNPIYQNSLKLAVGYGDEYDEELLKSFINDAEEQLFFKISKEEEAKLEDLVKAIASSSVAVVSSVKSSPGGRLSDSDMVAEAVHKAAVPKKFDPELYGLEALGEFCEEDGGSEDTSGEDDGFSVD